MINFLLRQSYIHCDFIFILLSYLCEIKRNLYKFLKNKLLVFLSLTTFYAQTLSLRDECGNT